MNAHTRTALALTLTVSFSRAFGGCGDEFASPSQILTFRAFGARIENLSRVSPTRSSEAAPGERVRVSLSYFDPSPTMRPISFVWVFCPQAARMGTTVGCTPQSATIAMGPTVEYTIPAANYSVDTLGRARIQGVMIACAGGTVGFDPTTMLPTCAGQGAESVTMLRSIRVRTTELDPANRNPEIREVVLQRWGTTPAEAVAIDPMTPARVPRCTADPCPEHVFEVRATEESRETYETLNNSGAPITQPERLQFGFFATGGKFDLTFVVDTAGRPMGPVRNPWKVPTTAGTYTLFFSVQDVRGGFDWVTRRVTVE